jgi:hypothetical protein
MPDLLLREVWDVPVVLDNILGPKNEIKILYNTVVDNGPPSLVATEYKRHRTVLFFHLLTKNTLIDQLNTRPNRNLACSLVGCDLIS